MAYQGVGWENTPSTKTPITADNLRTMDDQIIENEKNISKITPKVYEKVLNAGDTTIVFSGFDITNETKLSLYAFDKIISPTDISVGTTSVMYTFESQTDDLNLRLEVL